MVRHVLAGHAVEPLVGPWIAEQVRLQPIHTMVTPDVELMPMNEVVENHSVNRPVVPPLGPRPYVMQIEAIDPERSIGVEADAIHLPGVAIRIEPVRRSLLVAVVADEHLVGAAADNLRNAGCRRPAEYRASMITAADVPIAVGHGVGLQVQAI